jgi:hypothetical protein
LPQLAKLEQIDKLKLLNEMAVLLDDPQIEVKSAGFDYLYPFMQNYTKTEIADSKLPMSIQRLFLVA